MVCSRSRARCRGASNPGVTQRLLARACLPRPHHQRRRRPAASAQGTKRRSHGRRRRCPSAGAVGSSTMPFVPVGDIALWCERSGEGTGRPTLVLTHGFAGPTAGWPPIIDAFRREFDLVLYDVRAHGRTGMPADAATVTVPRFAADIAALLDGLGIERAHI